MIGATRSAVLAASLLMVGPAVAAQPEGGHYVWVPAGEAVMMVPRTAPTAVGFPVAHMLAQQQAMMQRMFADMDSLMAMPMPDPGQMIRAAMQGMPQAMPGSGVVVTSITTGNGTCSQTITYTPGAGGQPVVKTSSTGDACGRLSSPAPLEATQPAAPQPAAAAHGRLWTIGYTTPRG